MQIAIHLNRYSEYVYWIIACFILNTQLIDVNVSARKISLYSDALWPLGWMDRQIVEWVVVCVNARVREKNTKNECKFYVVFYL